MGFFPLFADLTGEPVLVVGGGSVALRRIPRLLEEGARITLISPVALPGLKTLAEQGRILWIRRGYLEGDEASFRLVFALTDDPEVNDRIASRTGGPLTNVATRTAVRPLTVPATRKGESVVLAVACRPPDPERSRKLADLCLSEIRRRDAHA